jgi:hypothetical protein
MAHDPRGTFTNGDTITALTSYPEALCHYMRADDGICGAPALYLLTDGATAEQEMLCLQHAQRVAKTRTRVREDDGPALPDDEDRAMSFDNTSTIGIGQMSDTPVERDVTETTDFAGGASGGAGGGDSFADAPVSETQPFESTGADCADTSSDSGSTDGGFADPGCSVDSGFSGDSSGGVDSGGGFSGDSGGGFGDSGGSDA